MTAKDENLYKDFSNYFNSNIVFLKLTGFWIYDDKTTKLRKKYLQLIYNSFWLLYMLGIYLPCEILYIYMSFRDLTGFLRQLRDIGNHISLAYKAVNYFLMRKRLFELMKTLQDTKYSYEEYETFQPKEIIKEEKQEALRWTKYFFNFCNAICLSMFLNGLFTFIFFSDKQFVYENGNKIYKQEHPVNILSPFGSGTKSKFFTTFIFTIIALTFFAWMIVALDSLFITLMSCISAHLKILQGAFKTLRNRCVSRLEMNVHLEPCIIYDPQNLQTETNKEMIKCIKHLQTLLRVSEQLEKIYSTQTFIQTFISLGEMCFSLYLLSETVDASIGNEITYLIATGFELLMYCWFGNRITEASLQVSYSLYDSEWFSTNLAFKKQTIFTMTRMQRPIYVTIGKITPLTFNTFLTIARGAYSFFTFLKQRKGLGK